MPRVNAVVACEGISIDALTGRITAFNILDTVYVPRVPAVLPRLHVLVASERVPEVPVNGAAVTAPTTLKERVTISAPNGRVLSRTEPTEIEFTLTLPYHNSLHTFWGMRFDEEGVVTIVVEHQREGGEWLEVSKRTLLAQLVAHPLMPPQPSPPASSGEPPP